MSFNKHKSRCACNAIGSEATATAELALPLTDLSHLFNAPRVDPWSHAPLEVGGIAGFEHMFNLLHQDRKLQRSRRLTLLLPTEKASAAQPEETTRALHRHASWRIECERREMRNTYRYGWKVAGFSVVMLAVCLALSSLFASDVTQWMRPLIRKTFEYGFEIIGWVILWHPIDVLVFSPVAIRARLSALQSLASMEIVIRAEPTPDAAAGASQP